MKIIFIADFFANEILGGGELNNQEFIKLLKQQKQDIVQFKSQQITPEFINNNSGAYFIISNFILLSPQSLNCLKDKNYIIYEHDHKYLTHRNPSMCKNFKCSSKYIVNYDFYRNAKAVLCQSQFHSDIVEKNLKLKNIVNLGGNLWSLDSISKMREISKKDKTDKCSILDSNILHKNTAASVQYCISKGYEYELIKSNSYHSFLEALGKNKKFCFFPKTPETLSRVVVEARMMNMSVAVNSLIGAASEPWFSLKGEELIDIMINKRKEIPERVLKICHG